MSFDPSESVLMIDLSKFKSSYYGEYKLIYQFIDKNG